MSRQNPPPTLRDVLDQAIKGALGRMNCVQIGRIEAFNATNQTATVSIAYQRKIKNAVLQEGNLEARDRIIPYPLLVQVPVVILKGGVSRLTMPIAKGDECLLFFADREIDTWFQYGPGNQPPAHDRIHDLTDAIALVGISSYPNLLTDYNTLISSLIDMHGERLAQTGDLKMSIRTDNHSGWILMDGSTLGKTGSGADYEGEAYRALFDFVKECSPNTGSEDFDDGDTVAMIDGRGRSAVGADDGAGVLTTPFTPNKDTMGGLIGEESHLLTGKESGIQQHNHVIPITNYLLDAGGIYITGNRDRVSMDGDTTRNTGHTNAIDKHNNVQPGFIGNWFIKI